MQPPENVLLKGEQQISQSPQKLEKEIEKHLIRRKAPGGCFRKLDF